MTSRFIMNVKPGVRSVYTKAKRKTLPGSTSSLSVASLKERCRILGLVQSGTKADLIKRLDSQSSRNGSFLLQTKEERSEASEAISALKGVSATNKNLEVGTELIAQREQQMGKNVSIFYKQDGGLVVTSGQGVFLHDVDGNTHLDCCNNVAAIGHSHPAVVKAGTAELQKIQTNARFLNPVQQRYLTKLLNTFPPELNTVFLVNSGSEANDLALRIARSHTTALRGNDVAVLDHAYHGHTQSLVDISPYKWYQATDGRTYRPKSTHVMSCPDSYRGIHRGAQNGPEGEEVAAKYAKEVEKLVSGKAGGVGVFIAESILGCGGQVVPPPTYLQRAYAAIRKKGGVCIADEVQTGFARAGTHFWMFQQHDVVPDIVTFGKPMGNGYPVAAVVCRREIADSFAATGIEYFNTYGGNSVACAIAESVLDTIQDEELQQSALEVGQYVQEEFSVLAEQYEWIGDVRGSGLFMGVEFVVDKHATGADLDPHPELTKFVVDYLRQLNVIISRDGPDGNVIKIKPPMVFDKSNVDTLVAGVKEALDCAVKLGTF